MADEQKPEKRKVRMRKIETVRERAEKAQKNTQPKKHRVSKAARHVARPLKAAHRIGKKEYYPLRIRGENRVSRFLNERRYFIPRYFRDAWSELQLVVWPSRTETLKLTLAVFIFAAIFGVVITITDYGLENLFRRILL